MRRLLIFSLTFLLLWPSIAPAFHDSMPEEIYGKLQGFGVTFLEYDGPVLEKQGCSHVQQTLLKSGSLARVWESPYLRLTKVAPPSASSVSR